MNLIVGSSDLNFLVELFRFGESDMNFDLKPDFLGYSFRTSPLIPQGPINLNFSATNSLIDPNE